MKTTHCVRVAITSGYFRDLPTGSIGEGWLQLFRSKGVNKIQMGTESVYEVVGSKAAQLHATCIAGDESNTQSKERSESEVMTAMTYTKPTVVKNDKDRFTQTELSALRNDLLQGGMIDSYEAAELLQVFLMGRGYGVSAKAALDAAGRVEMAGCALPVLQHELENLAMVM
jgi:hypothetical protein